MKKLLFLLRERIADFMYGKARCRHGMRITKHGRFGPPTGCKGCDEYYWAILTGIKIK